MRKNKKPYSSTNDVIILKKKTTGTAVQTSPRDSSTPTPLVQ